MDTVWKEVQPRPHQGWHHRVSILIRLVATQMKEKALLCAKNNKKDEVA
jgi:hypothetical protein